MDFEDQFREIPVFEVFVRSSSSSSGDNGSVVLVGCNPESAFVLHQIGEGGRGAFRSGGVDGIQTREQAANRNKKNETEASACTCSAPVVRS